MANEEYFERLRCEFCCVVKLIRTQTGWEFNPPADVHVPPIAKQPASARQPSMETTPLVTVQWKTASTLPPNPLEQQLLSSIDSLSQLYTDFELVIGTNMQAFIDAELSYDWGMALSAMWTYAHISLLRDLAAFSSSHTKTSVFEKEGLGGVCH